MERITRSATSLRLAIVTCGIALLSACGNDDTRPAEIATPTDAETELITVSTPDGKTITGKKKVIAGELRDFPGRDLDAEGKAQGLADARGDATGWIGKNPCEVVKPQDLVDWPGGIGNVSSERNNVATIVLGCVYKFEPTGGRPGGTIAVYFSDNQTPEAAAESVELMPNTSQAKPVTDWEKPAAYDATTGEFVWAHGRTFVLVQIAHPSVAKDRLAWTKRIASNVESRL